MHNLGASNFIGSDIDLNARENDAILESYDDQMGNPLQNNFTDAYMGQDDAQAQANVGVMRGRGRHLAPAKGDQY